MDKQTNIPQNQFVILLVRDEEKIIPDGDTLVLEKDVFLIFSSEGSSPVFANEA